MTNLEWLTPQGIFNYYLGDAETADGRLVLDLLEECREELTFETSIFDMTGRKDEDLPEFTRHAKPLQTVIKDSLTGIHDLMIVQAEHLGWVAFGRRHPDAEEEVIPARYWPFLNLDTEKRIAKGDDMTFRAVRGLITRKIPAGHPVLDRIRDAQKIVKAPSAPDSKPVSQPAVPETGAPGRPSSMHLIKPEFQRRADAGTIEKSLNKESQALVAWLKTAHPAMPPLTPKTVANNLREEYRNATQSI